MDSKLPSACAEVQHLVIAGGLFIITNRKLAFSSAMWTEHFSVSKKYCCSP